VSGSVGENRERLIKFIAARGIELEFKQSIAPALGMSYSGRIAVLPGQAPAEEFSTLVHELAHEMLHKAERRTATTKTVRETEAEAIAFVVGTSIGLETGHASADYIQLYHGNAALLAESLEVIQKTSALILSAIATVQVASDPTEATTQPTTDATDAALARWPNADRPRHPQESRRLAARLSLKIENQPHMSLVIEAMDESGPCGLPALSVAHYGEQNGDLMRDPEMCFELGFAGGAHLSPYYWLC